MSRFSGISIFLVAATVLAAFVLLSAIPVVAQATISTGSIQGTITDPQGAVVTGAKVIVANRGTGQKVTFNTSSTGAFTTGALIPGDYLVRIEAPGFESAEKPVVVQVGVITPANIKMTIGKETQTITVEGNAVTVNTEQATLQGVITTQQIDNLPFNGRNFLDLAQLEPGVQIQDGSEFDPTKNGFSSISFGGRAGRTARIEVDGIDISDETVGTTTQNISAAAIQEFQASQSSLDLSSGLTSSGEVNVTIRSGTNDLHGQGFYLFRDKDAGIANFPGGQDLPFQRHQFGGSLGGPIVKDKLFFFLNAERVKQDALTPVTFNPPFGFNASFTAPFRDTEALGKLDYQMGDHGVFKGLHLFYRFNYENNSDVAPFSFTGPSTSTFINRDNTPSHLIGFDFLTGRFTHQVRFGYMKFQNHIGDAVLGTASVFDPHPRVEIRVTGALETGPNLLATQATFQINKETKYDGTYQFGAHILRYGVDFNRFLDGA